jgi:flagellar biosynthesis regulator FlaF
MRLVVMVRTAVAVEAKRSLILMRRTIDLLSADARKNQVQARGVYAASMTDQPTSTRA